MGYGSVNVPGVSGPELDAVRELANSALDTANSALEKANEALEEGGGSGCVLKITFDAEFAGQKYTVTDGKGDTKTGIVPEGLVESVSVKNCNTEYTISSTASDGQEYSNTVTTGAYFGQYEAVLQVFGATINVTAVAGATVKAVCDGSEYTATAASNGVAKVAVKKAGNYTVSGTKDNAASNTATVNVTTTGQTYTATIKWITLVLTSPVGSAITVKKGSDTLSGTSTGTDTFYLPSTGTWTVSISLSGETASDTVGATAYQEYKLELAYVHIYGASWDGTSTTKWTRTDEAAGFIDPVPAVSNGSGSSPFDALQPWAGMVKSERTGGTMVAIPKFWYKITQSGSGMKIQIADKEVDGYSVSPAHMDRGDGSGERDVVYVGRYHCGSSAYKSVSGQTPKVNITRSTARSSIHSLGSKIWQMDFAMRFTIWLLYIVEFADWNSQAKIGYGCAPSGSTSAVRAMGYTDNMKYHTGTDQASRTTYGGTQYRNIEGLWDNCYDWMDGCYYNGNGMNVILNPNNFSDSSGGTSIGTPSSGYPSAFGVKNVAGTFPTFIPTAASGSDSTYSCDVWGFGSSDPCLYVGGDYGQDTYHGLFFVSYDGTSYAYANFGCRLQELP